MTPRKKIILGTISFISWEMVSLYLYSLVWLSEAPPGRKGDPVLVLLAWLCISATILGFLIPAITIRSIGRDAVDKN